MKRRTVRIDKVQTAVLDEADRMLDMGFIHDVTKLLDQMKSRKNLGDVAVDTLGVHAAHLQQLRHPLRVAFGVAEDH